MRRARARASARQYEFPERRQVRIEVVKSGFEHLDPGVVDDARPGHRELGADVEQRMLGVDEGFPDAFGDRTCQNDSEMGVELVQIAHRRDPGRVLGQPAAVGQSGRAVVTGARVNP